MSTRKYDAFVSYNSADRDIVLQVVAELRSQGLNIWLDVYELLAGVEWSKAVEQAISESEAALVMVGASGIGTWHGVEIRGILQELVGSDRPVIPVLLPGAPSDVRLPLFLSSRTSVDFRLGLSPHGVAQIYSGIVRERHVSETAPISAPPTEGTVAIAANSVDEIFRIVGLPKYTYIEPRIYRNVANAVRQSGRQVIVEGSSGSGKTCMIFRILSELGFSKDVDYQYLSAANEQTEAKVAELLRQPSSLRKITVIDDLHYLSKEIRYQLSRFLKSLSDEVFADAAPPKFVLIGIPTAASGLIFNVHDLGPRIGSFRMPNANPRQLLKLIRDGEQLLRVQFVRPDDIVQEASGSFYLCQYICHEICYLNGITETVEDEAVLTYRIDETRQMLMEDLENRFHSPLVACLKRSGENGANIHSLVTMLRVMSETGKHVFDLGEIVARAGNDGERIRDLKDAIRQFIQNPGGNQTLSRLLHYDDEMEVFTIEDPMFGYCLRHVDFKSVAESSGVLDFGVMRSYTEPDANGVQSKTFHPGVSSGHGEARDQIFISYSHKDTKWLERLQTMLRPLVRANLLSTWSDAQIRTGDNWYEGIQRALSLAKVAVLLVSPSFLASDFIAKHELEPLLRSAEAGGLTIIWVPLSASLYKHTEIQQFQAAWDPSKPLNSLAGWRQDEALVEICEKIKLAALN